MHLACFTHDGHANICNIILNLRNKIWPNSCIYPTFSSLYLDELMQCHCHALVMHRFIRIIASQLAKRLVRGNDVKRDTRAWQATNVVSDHGSWSTGCKQAHGTKVLVRQTAWTDGQAWVTDQTLRLVWLSACRQANKGQLHVSAVVEPGFRHTMVVLANFSTTILV